MINDAFPVFCFALHQNTVQPQALFVFDGMCNPHCLSFLSLAYVVTCICLLVCCQQHFYKSTDRKPCVRERGGIEVGKGKKLQNVGVDLGEDFSCYQPVDNDC